MGYAGGMRAVQLAHLGGAQVTALVRDPADSAVLLRRLGATVVTAQLGGDFDVIMESVGGATFGRAIEHLARYGVLVNSRAQPVPLVVIAQQHLRHRQADQLGAGHLRPVSST
jgi:NADPH:quinone reductase-like Zn-dependent oxidoreductase